MNRASSDACLTAFLSCLSMASVAAWHKYPQTVFYNEFIAAAFIVLCGALAVWGPRVSAGISSLSAGILLIGVASFLFSGDAPVVGMFAYPAALLLLVLIVMAAIASLGRGRVVMACAWGVLVCAVLQCLISALQLAGVSVSGVVMVKLMNAAYGNIAQENHFANLLWLGLVSLGFLWLRRVVPTLAALVMAAIICIFSALSVSRAVWLYTLAVPFAALLYTRRMEVVERARVWRGALVLTGMSVVTQMWLAFGGAKSALGVTSAIDRVNEGGSNGQRLFDWTVALKTALAHPLTGVGPGLYSWQTALASIGLPPENYVRIGENAHNTVLHFAAEFGLVFALVLLGLIGFWLWRRWKEAASLESLWGLGILAVIAAHSLVEYPLWYVYFLVPVGCAIAVIDAGDESLPTLRFDARWIILPLAVAAWMLGSTWSDYRKLEAAYRTLNAETNLDAKTADWLDAVGASVSNRSLMAPQAALLRMRAWRNSDKARVPEIVAVCDAALRYKPQYNSLTACVAAYTFAGRKEDADLINEIACGAFAPVHSKPFVEYSQKLYAQRGWSLPEKGNCL